jgi:hypothetical protein
MEAADIPEGESRWFCPSCELQQVRGYIPSLVEHVTNRPFRMPPEYPIKATSVIVIATHSPPPVQSAGGVSAS